VTWRGAATVFVGLALAAAVASGPTSGGEAGIDGRAKRICDRVAGLSGHDSAPGTLKRPYRTVRRLLAGLRPGGVGCLLKGTFVENVRFDRGGAPGRPITLRSAPGVRAGILGYVWVKSTANDVTIQGIRIDGHDVNPDTVQVNGDRVKLRDLVITNRNKAGRSYTGVCVLAGPHFEVDPANTAYDLTVSGSRIHNCGDDAHEHAIYLESTRNAHVVDSYLYDNPGYGVHMYPDAQGSLIEYDVIDGNSSRCKANLTFSGEKAGGEYSRPHGSSNNVVRYSLITNSLCRYNVESYYPTGSLRGVGNVVDHSCVWNAPLRNFARSPGYIEHDNIDDDPRYVDRARKDFRLQSASPCLGLGPAAIQPGASAARRHTALASPS
jgi:hypothetical protein